MSTSAGPSCPRPFNHLKFFAGELIVGALVFANSFVFSRTQDHDARLMIGGLCIVFFLANIGIHVYFLLAHMQRNIAYPYRPTATSVFTVLVIHVLIFIALMTPAWPLFRMHLHK